MDIQVTGPAGLLQARLDVPAGAAPDNRCAVLCHPHPLYGGSMHDGVLGELADTLLAHGLSVVRFNFRGVGGSAGTHDGGAGEVDDLQAVVRWVADEHSDQQPVLGGYSFGAHVTWNTLANISCASAVLVAPPTAVMGFGDQLPGCPVSAVYGDQDDYVDPDKLPEAVKRYPVAGGDHFFSARQDELRECLHAACATGVA